MSKVTPSKASSAAVDKFLSKATSKAAPPRPKAGLVFGLDATGSREHTWDLAMHSQVEMFHEAGRVGALSSLDVQLVYFRGTSGANAECKASSWMTSPTSLASYMATIKCRTGLTQIERVLKHIVAESQKRKIGAAVFVGDACEEPMRKLEAQANMLAEMKVPLFMFREGKDLEATQAFEVLAHLTGGAHLPFDSGSAKQLGDLLRAVAAFTTGGVLALEGTSTGRLLLGQMRK